MRDIFPDGLMTLDGLEVTGNTAATARWLNCDQSSISRVYRRVSQQLELGFCKQTRGYGATSNQQLLGCLRQAAQLHRLLNQPQRLQWLNLAASEPMAALPSQFRPIPCRPCSPRRAQELVQQRVIDLLMVDASVANALSATELSSLTLQSGVRLVVLREFEHHAAVQQLIAALNALPA